MADRIIFVGILVLAGIYFYSTEQLPTLQIGDPLGPKAFPRLLGVALLFSAVLLFFEMRRARKTAPAKKPQPAEPAEPAEQNMYHIIAGVTVWTFLYIVVFEPLGYVIATSIYLLALMAFFHPGKWVSNVLTAILFSAGSYWLFGVLGVNLGRGILPV